MTTRKEESTNKISRRRFIQTVAAGTVAASTSGLAATMPLEGIGLDDPPDTNDIFPILALWLAMTTNETFVNLSPADLKMNTGRSSPDAQNAINRAQGEKKALYQQIRTEFQSFRTTLGYSGTQCPRKLDTIKTVSQSKLPQ